MGRRAGRAARGGARRLGLSGSVVTTTNHHAKTEQRQYSKHLLHFFTSRAKKTVL
jgi:hypothetical protein